MTTKRIDCLATKVIPELLRGFGGVGIQICDLFLHGYHEEITSYSVDPQGYTDWGCFMRDYCAVSLLRKYTMLRTKIDKSSVAMTKFQESEARCRAVNARFSHLRSFSFKHRSLLEAARAEVRRILRGNFTWDAILPYVSHGPGATFGTKRDKGHPWYKFGEQTPTVTGECLALTLAFNKARPLISELWESNGIDPKVVLGSKVTTVPKDARSDRVIAIEPMLNMFFQKGIGGLMRSRLKQAGCDLNDQSVNQSLAKIGSIDGSLATIDLASASDSVSRGLVEFMIPPDWLTALKVCRSAQFLLPDGKFHYIQKFSSMGNGYTFELESLIFLAIGRAVVVSLGGRAREVAVYGDDIIVPSSAASLLIEVLDQVGFSTNLEKTFIDGPFRESCGKHFFLGHDVTPFYLKKKVVSPDELFLLLNSIRLLAFRLRGLGWGCCSSLLKAYLLGYSLVPARFRGYSVPLGYGNGGLLRDFDEVSPKPKTIRGWVEGFTTRHLVRRFGKRRADEWPALLWHLSSLERRAASSSGRVYVQDERPLSMAPKGAPESEIPLRTYKLVAAKLRVTQWYGVGPWS
jgi:hypothetical protein